MSQTHGLRVWERSYCTRVHGYRIYNNIWEAAVRETIAHTREERNSL